MAAAACDADKRKIGITTGSIASVVAVKKSDTRIITGRGVYARCAVKRIICGWTVYAASAAKNVFTKKRPACPMNGVSP
jgi:hypothetical protein